MMKTPLKKLARNKKTVLLYLFLMILSYLLLALFIFSDVPLQKWVVISVNVLFLCSFISFLSAWLKEPGYLKPDDTINFLSLLKIFKPDSLCPECEVIRIPRSRHCNICNRCVGRFDHHCPWINNCVGNRNHRWFFLYIMTTLLYAVFVIYISVLVLLHLWTVSDVGKSL